MPLISLYYGQNYELFGEEGAARYHQALDEEFAVLTALSLYDEAVGNSKVWQISHDTYAFVKKVIESNDLPPLPRPDRSDLPWSAVLEKVEACRFVPAEKLTYFRKELTVSKIAV